MLYSGHLDLAARLAENFEDSEELCVDDLPLPAAGLQPCLVLGQPQLPVVAAATSSAFSAQQPFCPTTTTRPPRFGILSQDPPALPAVRQKARNPAAPVRVPVATVKTENLSPPKSVQLGSSTTSVTSAPMVHSSPAPSFTSSSSPLKRAPGLPLSAPSKITNLPSPQPATTRPKSQQRESSSSDSTTSSDDELPNQRPPGARQSPKVEVQRNLKLVQSRNFVSTPVRSSQPMVQPAAASIGRTKKDSTSSSSSSSSSSDDDEDGGTLSKAKIRSIVGKKLKPVIILPQSMTSRSTAVELYWKKPGNRGPGSHPPYAIVSSTVVPRPASSDESSTDEDSAKIARLSSGFTIPATPQSSNRSQDNSGLYLGSTSSKPRTGLDDRLTAVAGKVQAQSLKRTNVAQPAQDLHQGRFQLPSDDESSDSEPGLSLPKWRNAFTSKLDAVAAKVSAVEKARTGIGQPQNSAALTTPGLKPVSMPRRPAPNKVKLKRPQSVHKPSAAQVTATKKPSLLPSALKLPRSAQRASSPDDSSSEDQEPTQKRPNLVGKKLTLFRR